MKNKIKKLISFFLCILIILVGAFGVYIGLREYYKKYYPRDYSQFVEKYSKEFDIDEYLVFSIIKTESDFNPKAVSKDGASGLMQIMPDTYDWIKSKKIDSADHTYSDIFDTQMNIMYGTYLISSLYKEFGNYETALAAYHAGRGKTKEWLNNSKYSSDQKTLHTIEYKETQQYVKKVMNTYKRYKNLYAS